MKKKIEAELVKLAEKILQEKGKSDVEELKLKARNLYEKLSILAFTQKHLEELPEEPQQKPEKPAEVKSETPREEEKPEYFKRFSPDGTEYNDSEAITEPATEKIKDIVAEMPRETENTEDLFGNITPPPGQKPEPPKPRPEKPVQREKPVQKEKPAEKKPENGQTGQKDFRHIGVDYDNLPNFEPLNNRQKDQRPKSLNDRLKKGINIGLNERLAYIKHLFDGNTADYNRVLSQLNTFSSLEEAQKFIQKVVKPDYNYWEGKEEYEQRFMEVVESKFSK